MNNDLFSKDRFLNNQIISKHLGRGEDAKSTEFLNGSPSPKALNQEAFMSRKNMDAMYGASPAAASLSYSPVKTGLGDAGDRIVRT